MPDIVLSTKQDLHNLPHGTYSGGTFGEHLSEGPPLSSSPESPVLFLVLPPVLRLLSVFEVLGEAECFPGWLRPPILTL